MQQEPAACGRAEGGQAEGQSKKGWTECVQVGGQQSMDDDMVVRARMVMMVTELQRAQHM